MSQVTSESILTTKEIVEQAIKDYHKQILPYLNGEFPVAVVEKFAEGNLYTTDEKIIGQWIDGKPLYQIVRDTPFSDVSLIPTMTSNTSDVCEVSSNGYYQDNYSYKAFDNDDSTYWASYTNNYGYLDVHFFTAQTVVKIDLKPKMRSTTSAVKDFEIWGSNDNFKTHDVLLSATCQNSSDVQSFNLSTTGSYSYYRLNILNAWTTSDISVGAVQLNLIGEGQGGITILDTRILNGKYVYQYTKVGDDPINIGSITDYSTTEKVVGTWIDGKPIYQKTFSGVLSTSSTEESIAHNISNVDLCIERKGFIVSNNFAIQFGFYNGSEYNNIFMDKTNLNFRHSRVYAGCPYKVTVLYTKTTD